MRPPLLTLDRRLASLSLGVRRCIYDRIARERERCVVRREIGSERCPAKRLDTRPVAKRRDYVYENSRRYHKYQEGRYHFPNDDAEQEREDMQHAMFMLLCDSKLHFAPLENPRSILDIGTGTGIWAIESKHSLPQEKNESEL